MCKRNIFFICVLLVLCWGLPAQESLPVTSQEDNPLEKSLSLINDTILLIENIENDNESLKVTLDNVSDMLKTQGELLNEQARTQEEQSKISERQSILLGRELRKGKILKWSLIISVPVFTGLGMWVERKLSR